MSQATVTDRPYHNSNLFSSHYLDDRVIERDEWDCDADAREAFDALQSLYDIEGPLVEGYSEDALIDDWIDEILEILGFGTQVEVTLPERVGYVDELLFENTSVRRDAASVYLDTDDTTDLFERGLGLVEVKQWDADFTQRFAEQRPYRNASHQIKHYLENTPENIQWGVLTNGRKWRLYGTKDYETQTFYEVDLPALLERGDVEAFKYFYVFFRPAAFREAAGTTFLDEVWSESETASQELGEDLQDNVFTALRVLGRGFIETNDLEIAPDDEQALDELKDQSLVLLYRLMFVLYAEARGLIHPEGQSAQDEYEDNFSLDALRLEIHDAIGEVDEGFAAEFSEYSTGMWSRLEDLFRLIDQGEASLGIPPYNGGLFDHDEHAFLTDHEVSNRYLAEVIYRLSTTQNGDNRYVLADYADLDTRHLGSVYEGLLEHQFRIAPKQYAAISENGGQVWESATEVSVADAVETVPAGGLYVVNDQGERKATGAYYTPDYVVTYIVEKTVGPLVDEIRKDLIEIGFKPGSEEYIGPFSQRIMDLNILDPAMGSGHFLTKATGYLAERVMEEVREVESELGVAFDEQHIRREIAKECIYGVDLNGMAVELAKLSMWLETLAADRPLAFLDHHFKEGNSLVGSELESIEELESDADGDEQQYSLAEFGATREGTIERLMDIYSEFLEIENETVEDVREMKRKYAEIEQDELRRRLVALANVHASEKFGNSVPSGGYERMAKSLKDEKEWERLEDYDWFESAQEIAEREGFFHWRLEFPEVFYEQDATFNPDESGFDVLIGNPPYLNMDNADVEISQYLKTRYPDIQKGQSDILYFFVIRGVELLKPDGFLGYIIARYFMGAHFAEGFREYLLKNTTIDNIVDFKNHTVFRNVGTKTCISILRKNRGEGTNSIDYLHIPQRRTSRVNVPSSMTDPKESDIFEYIKYPQSELSIHRWVFPSQSERELIRKVDTDSWRLGDISRVGMGMQTGANSVFEVTQEEITEHNIESELLRKVVSNEEIRRYVIDYNGRYWIYTNPYNNIESEFPNAFNYLKQFKDDLEDRIAIERGDCEWYEFSYARHTELYDGKKILTPFIAPHNRFAIDDEGDIYSSTDSQVIFPTIETPVGLRYLVCLLNSKLLNWRYQHLGKMKDYRYEYSKDAISKLPIRKTTDDTQANFDLPSNQTLNTKDINLAELKKENVEKTLIELSNIIIRLIKEKGGINLSILDYLSSYTEGPRLSEIGNYQPPTGVGDTYISATTNDLEKLRVGRVECIRQGEGRLQIQITARYKPEDEDSEDTDRWGYTESEFIPAMNISGLDEIQMKIIEHFVPYVVDEAGGFADFRESATKTISLVDRLEDLRLPDPEKVSEKIERYTESVRRAEELQGDIKIIEELIDEIVYNLYGLTDEEIKIVERAVSSD